MKVSRNLSMYKAFFQKHLFVSGGNKMNKTITYLTSFFFLLWFENPGAESARRKKIAFLNGQNNNEEKSTRQRALIKTRAVLGRTRAFRAKTGFGPILVSMEK